MTVTAVPLRPIAKGTLPKLWIGVGLLLIVAIGFALYATSPAKLAAASPEAFLAYNGSRDEVVTTESGLQYEVLEPGEGEGTPGPDDVALVNYEGRFTNGEVFDASEGAAFSMGAPVPGFAMRPVEGFAEAIQAMRPGARHRVWIPPALGYGETPPEGSPFDSDTIMEFDIELIDFVPRAQLEAQIQQMMEQQGAPLPGQ